MRNLIGISVASLLCIVECQADPIETPHVEFVTDLAKVAGCQFLGTVKSPRATLGSRRAEDFDRYNSMMQTIAASHGATHLYVLNRAAGWGGAAAFGAAYSCQY
ncbi:hypothetical protein [Methylorubrum sp. GM97]|uniref:hypothetical protein n=1 Tax=Methylorubrum sp. GM97 TaxID=2938232 RepID=UPI0021C2AFB5|nr:hypothetical protein [Methylorubrum sp. GM97]